MQPKLFLAFIISIGFITTTFSQVDAHYWTHQYGAKGLLLNGAVIASAEGETSLFYNPGSIGMDDNLGFAFSFLSPSYANLKTKNFIGDGNVITDDGLSFAPGFLGIRFKPFKTDKIVAGVTAFKRFKTDIKFENRVTGLINESLLLLFRGDLDFERKISEDWYGIGLFYRISKHMGIGATQFSVWHNQSLDLNLKKEIVFVTEPDQTQLSWRSEIGYDINVNSGFVTKLGYSLRYDQFNVGLTYTSPIYGIARKSSKYILEDHRVNVTTDLYTSTSNRGEADMENFKSAGSFGFGLDCKIKKTVLSISTEYFTKVDNYFLFREEDDSFDGQSIEEEIVVVNLSSQNASVFNFAAGIMHESSEKITILGGFRTDKDQNNSLVLNGNTEYLGTTGNVYHISGGGLFQFGKNQISLGLDIGWGGKKDDKVGRQLVDLSNITQENIYQIAGKDNVTSSFYSAMLFITYDFIFSGIGGGE